MKAATFGLSPELAAALFPRILQLTRSAMRVERDQSRQ
jgi:hypothetical protein